MAILREAQDRLTLDARPVTPTDDDLLLDMIESVTLDVLARMGARIETEVVETRLGEPVAFARGVDRVPVGVEDRERRADVEPRGVDVGADLLHEQVALRALRLEQRA